MSTTSNPNRDRLGGPSEGGRSEVVGADHRNSEDTTDLAAGHTRDSHDATRRETSPHVDRSGAATAPSGHDTVREEERFGGVKVGSAFFGWLTATGVAVLLTALVVAAGTAVGLGSEVDVADVTAAATEDLATIGIVGGLILLVALFVAYFCGGYVAGRMARFDGAKQGVAVWAWAIVVALVVAVLGAIAGREFNVLANLDIFPRIPIGEGDLSTAGVLVAIGVALTSLAGAVVGGLTGMRYHRIVDRAGYGQR